MINVSTKNVYSPSNGDHYTNVEGEWHRVCHYTGEWHRVTEPPADAKLCGDVRALAAQLVIDRG
jgi:hypothetical protein